MINKILLVFSMIIFSGCFAKYNLIKKNPYENRIPISGKLNEIKITDARQNVIDREIKIPHSTFPGMNDELSQKLQDFTKQTIRKEISNQFSGNSDTILDVEVKIIKGMIGFRAYAFTELQYTEVEIDIITTDQLKNVKKFQSNIYLEINSFDASPKYLHLLFERALINAIHKCFIKSEIGIETSVK